MDEALDFDSTNDPEKELFKEQKLLNNKRLESLIKLREKYAQKSFTFMARYATATVIIVVANGLEIMDVGSTPLAALVGTISASMVLFGWVLKGLFSSGK